jgi:hypothetical protein
MIVESPPAKTTRNWVEKRNRCFAGRRSGAERRVFYSIDYFIAGGQEGEVGPIAAAASNAAVPGAKTASPASTHPPNRRSPRFLQRPSSHSKAC